MENTFKIMLAQLNNTPCGIGENFKQALSAIKEAKDKNCTLVVFPQDFLSGYPYCDMHLKFPHLIDKCHQFLEKICSETSDIAVLIGYFGKMYFLNNKEIIQVDGDFDFIHLKSKKIAFVRSENYKKPLDLKEADVALIVKSTPTRCGAEEMKNQKYSSFAKENSIKTIVVNQIGAFDHLTFEGGSRVYDEKGKLTGVAEFFKEDLYEIDLDKTDYKKSDFINDLKPCQAKFSLDYDYDLKRTYEAVILSIKDYFRKNGFSKAVLGLSGGIDSSLCAALLSDALGKENVLGILMPSVISSEGSITLSEKLAQNLGIEYFEVPISSMVNASYDAICKVKTKHEKCAKSYMKDNIQARSRAVILFGIANEIKGMLPIATSDKSEAYVGYATVNGDMAGSFAPIADVTKTKAWALARFINKKRYVIPEEIINKRPTAELEINPETGTFLLAEEALMPYEFLDEAIWYFENKQAHIEDMMEFEFEYEKLNTITQEQKIAWLQKFFARMQGALYKWSLIATYPIVDRKSLQDNNHGITVKIPR